MTTLALAALPFFAVWTLATLAVIRIKGRRVASRMTAECNGLCWTGANGRRYQWRDGRAYDAASGRRVAI